MPPQSATPPAGTASPAARVVREPSGQGETLLAMLFPHLAGLQVHRVEDIGEAGDLRDAPGGIGVLPALQAGVGAGARRVLADGG